MRAPQAFNPYIIDTRHGVIHGQHDLNERMCLWYELELIPESSEDSGVITLDQFIPLSAGTIMFRKPGDIVKGIAPDSYNYIAIIFDAIYDPGLENFYAMGDDCSGDAIDKEYFNAFFKNSRDFAFLNEIPSVTHFEDDSDIHEMMIECIHHCESRQRDYQIYAKSLLMQMLIKVHGNPGYSGEKHAAPKSAAVLSTIEFMRLNFMKPLTLDMLAQQASMSREYFCRLFKSNTGMPPMAYLQHIRIFSAKSMLLTTSLTMEEVASACGYENVNYFYSVFRKACGMTPSQYRR